MRLNAAQGQSVGESVILATGKFEDGSWLLDVFSLLVRTFDDSRRMYFGFHIIAWLAMCSALVLLRNDGPPEPETQKIANLALVALRCLIVQGS